MRVALAVQLVFTVVFLLLGVLATLGLGITGLLFLIAGMLFAVVAALVKQASRGGAAIALLADGGLAWLAAIELDKTLAEAPRLIELAPAIATLLLTGVAFLALVADWRTLRSAPWI